MNIVVTVTIDTLFRRIIESHRLVAILAVCIAVGSDQRKIGEAVIEQHTLGPILFVVTLSAGLAELILVSILLSVTGVTICLQTQLVDRSGMTLRAADLSVPAQQREIRIDVMLEKHLRPACGRMAAFAGLAIQTFMLVVRRMARDTFGLELFFKFIRNMTVGAGDIAMRTSQRESRPGRVIEKRFSPGAADMTECAIGAVKALVRIVLSMTCVTLCRGIQVARFNMAR